ncbi:DNA repair protein RecO [Actinomadura barringtoniae]|uniref:DNA repair protein RecO n=1 Tax=Actinomadura barringtoniae TaxID=1427535 RepID=A0A939T3E5_9ACTN|nr:DNA repair protein RecO [Actinomadura barringtoniae]MBO2446529.1 DNA repair protein RecO [Actinomadura barringtoniae]
MSLYRDEGIVLRTQKLGEADRIVTVLTRRTGKLRAAAKGVRKTKSRFGARLEPFTHVDLQLYERRSLDLITQAETLRPYGEPLVADYPRYTAGMAMLETTDKLTEEREPSLRQFLLLVGALRTLVERDHDSRLVLDAFLLRSLSVAGWAPAIDECCRCGERGQLRGFAIAAGGAVCARCRQPGAATPAPPTFALMLALLRGDWEYADGTEQRHRVECSGLVAAYLQWHLEHGIRSLRHVERGAEERGRSDDDSDDTSDDNSDRETV